MSLINDMLYDLESNRASENKLAAASVKAPDSSALNTNSSASWLPGVIAFFVVASLLIWQQRSVVDEGSVNDQASLVLASDASVIESEKLTNKQPTEVILTQNYYPQLLKSMQPSAQAVNNTDSDAASVTNINTERQVTELLAAASKAFSLDRLLSPAEDNAVDRYRQILLLKPNHHQALAGLESVAKRYIALAEEYAREGSTARSDALFHRALTVMPENNQLSSMIAQSRQIAFSDYSASKITDANTVLPERGVSLGELSKVELSKAQQPKSEQSKAGLKSAPLAAHTPQARDLIDSNTASPAPVIVRSSYRGDQATAQHAQKLVNKGRPQEALHYLRTFISAQPKSIHALELYLHTLINLNSIREAQNQILLSNHLGHSRVTEFNARILASLDDVNASISLLEAELPRAMSDLSYQQYLAGLYHRRADYTKAVAVYQRLLKAHGDKSEIWLGLAVSLDALNQYDAALNAFISAGKMSNNRKIQNYISNRIEQLSHQISKAKRADTAVPVRS